jgi:hypothetical protein
VNACLVDLSIEMRSMREIGDYGARFAEFGLAVGVILLAPIRLSRLPRVPAVIAVTPSADVTA